MFGFYLVYSSENFFNRDVISDFLNRHFMLVTVLRKDLGKYTSLIC